MKGYRAVLFAKVEASPDDCEKRYARFGEEVLAFPTDFPPDMHLRWWIDPTEPDAEWAEDADTIGVGAIKGDLMLLEDGPEGYVGPW